MTRLAAMSVVFLLLTACEQRFVSADELRKYPLDPDNGLIHKIEKANTVLEMYYKPTDLVVAQELTGITNDQERKNAISRFDTLDYFVLRLSRDNREIETSYAGDQNKFTEVVNYLASSIRDDLYMICGKDTIPTFQTGYAQMFGSTTASSVLVVFNSDLKHRDADARIYYDDSVLGTGLSEFEFDIDNMKNIPRLNFQQQ